MNLFNKTLAVCESTQTPEQCVVAARYLQLAKAEGLDYHWYNSIKVKLTNRMHHIIVDEMMMDLKARGFDIRHRAVGRGYRSWFIHDEAGLYVARITFENNKYHSHKTFALNAGFTKWLKDWEKQL